MCFFRKLELEAIEISRITQIFRLFYRLAKEEGNTDDASLIGDLCLMHAWQQAYFAHYDDIGELLLYVFQSTFFSNISSN